MQNKLDRGAKLLEEKRKEASTAKAKADQIASQLKCAEKDVSFIWHKVIGFTMHKFVQYLLFMQISAIYKSFL